MTEKEQIQNQIQELQEKLKKLEVQEPKMLLLRQGKVDFVGYNENTYLRIEYEYSKFFPTAYEWYELEKFHLNLMPIKHLDLIDPLEELYQKEVVKQKDDYLYKKYAPEEVKKLQEKDKARHKTRIVDKDGNDHKPEPLTAEELLKPKWEPKPQSEEEVADGLKEAFVKAQQTEKWKEIQKLIDEEDNDKNFKNSLDLIKEWGEKNKPKSLYQICMEWWDEVFVNEMDNDICIDVLVSKIDKEFIPPIHNTNDYQWNKCLKMMRDKLRDT